MNFHEFEYKGSLFKSKLYFSGRQYKEYDVYLVKGKWPSDYDLVTICDGGDPARPWEKQLHGGGEVLPSEDQDLKHRIVRVLSGSAVDLDEDD